MRLIVISFFLLLSAATLSAQKIEYLQVVARPGDDVESLLVLYKLDKHACNLTSFYKINELAKTQYLYANQVYYLPIRVFKYNSKSIRSTLEINNWDKAKRIQGYNELVLKSKLRLTDYASSKILWVPLHELDCKATKVPTRTKLTEKPKEKEKSTTSVINRETSQTAEGNRIFPIFGKKFQHIPLESTKLKGSIYYIVGGHGGPDPGAIGWEGQYKLCEDEYAYDVALRLARQLISHGATVYIITRDPNDGIRSNKYLGCDKDEYCWGNLKMPLNQKERLTQRSGAISELYEKNKKRGVTYQRAIMIHVDSRNKTERTDLFFYYPQEDKGGVSLKMAKILQNTIKQKYETYQKNRGYNGTITSRDLHMLRETEVPSVYIELGNIRNKADQQRIILDVNRQALAKWLTEGLMLDHLNKK
ncbi:MAG: N-acetylmuramoyl-L-alanine amidase family protein [Chitinophagales bacterium]